MHHNEEEPSLATNRESLHIALRTQHSQKLNKQINPKRKKEKNNGSNFRSSIIHPGCASILYKVVCTL